MIYLFNSAFRAKYKVNVLNTLNLPDGVQNQYRFTSDANRKFVDQRIIDNPIINEKVLIIFVDRYDENGFKFYPLRKGVLKKVEYPEGKILFKVELGEIFTTNNINEFNCLIKDKFKDKVPSINKNGNPDIDGTGFFAFRGDNLTTKITPSEYPWRTASKQVSDCKAYDKSIPIFTKVEIIDVGKKIKYSTEYEIKRIEFKKGNTYRIVIDYYLPEQSENKDCSFPIELLENKEAFIISRNNFKLDNEYDRIEYEITVLSNTKIKYSSICFRIPDSNDKIIFNVVSIPIRIKDKISIWIGLGSLLIISAVINSIINTSTTMSNTLKICLTAVNAIVTLCLFIIYGKK